MKKNFFLYLLEFIFNKFLILESDVEILINPLINTKVLLNFTDLQYSILLIPKKKKFLFYNMDYNSYSSYKENYNIIDLVLESDIFGYIQFIKINNLQLKTFPKRIKFFGKIHILQAYKLFFQQINLDIKLFLLNFLKIKGIYIPYLPKIKTNVLKKISLNVEEFLQEEIKISPSIKEVKNWFDNVIIFRQNIDKLESKIINDL